MIVDFNQFRFIGNWHERTTIEHHWNCRSSLVEQFQECLQKDNLLADMILYVCISHY